MNQRVKKLQVLEKLKKNKYIRIDKTKTMNYVAMWRDKFIWRLSHDTRINGQVRELGKIKDELNEFKTLFWFRIVKATLSYVLFR